MSDVTPTATLARFAAALTWDAVPEAVRAVAKSAVLDTEAVIGAGRDLTPVPQLRATAADTPADRALVRGAAAHVLDFDDTCFAGITHGSAQIWPAVEAIARTRGLSGAESLTAFIAGSEACYAVGDVFGRQLYDAGWIPTDTLGPIGAAVGAATALGLNADGIGRAIGLTAASAMGLRTVMGTAAKPLLVGRAARLGVESAVLAEAGVGAPACVLSERLGMFAVFGTGMDLNTAALATLGQSWRLLEPGLVLKRFPLCSCAQAAAEAILDLMAEHAIASDAIAAIHADVMPMVSDTLTVTDPTSPAGAMFCLPFALACAAARGNITPADLHATGDAAIRALMDRVTVTTDAALAVHAEHPEAARVTLEVTDGRRVSKTVLAGRGDPRAPMTDADRAAKVTACGAGQDLIDAVHTLEAAPDLGALAAATQPETDDDLSRPRAVS